MLKDHRPYYIKKACLNFQKLYVRHFLRPQFESLGRGFTFMKPWHVEVFGAPIVLGQFAAVIATSDKKVRLAVWPNRGDKGAIQIGHYCMICPGVRLGSADRIEVGDNCMFAGNAYVTDSDWHDVYNRVAIGRTAPVTIQDNVWIGDSAIVCKGVSIGTNSIIGAGAVVVDDVPPNVIAAGNPARVVKHLDSQKEITTRAHWFANPQKLFNDFDYYDRVMLRENTLGHWLRHVLRPRKGE